MEINQMIIKEIAKDVIYLLLNEERFGDDIGNHALISSASDCNSSHQVKDMSGSDEVKLAGYEYKSLFTANMKSSNIILLPSDDDYPRVIINKEWKDEYEKALAMGNSKDSECDNIYIALSEACFKNLLLNQFVFQFSHELTHVIIGYYDNIESSFDGDNNIQSASHKDAPSFVFDYHSNYFIEIIAVAVSLHCLELIADAWKAPWELPALKDSNKNFLNTLDCPISYETKIQYASKFLQYRQQVINAGIESPDENDLYINAIKVAEVLKSLTTKGKNWKGLRKLGISINSSAHNRMANKSNKFIDPLDIKSWLSKLDENEQEIAHLIHEILLPLKSKIS